MPTPAFPVLLAATDPGPSDALITNPAAVLGILLVILAVVFQTERHPTIGRLYRVVPALLLCYFIPGLLSTAGIVADEGGRLREPSLPSWAHRKGGAA